MLGTFYLLDHLFNLKFRPKHYIFAIAITFAGILLSPLYFLYTQYDKILHFILPILFGSIVFHMVSKLNIEKKWKLTFVFFIIIGAIGLHEIGEYLLDSFFDLKLQGVFLRNLQGLEKYEILLDRNDDTMIDMSIGLLGAVSYIIFLVLRQNPPLKKKSIVKHSHPKRSILQHS